MANASDAVPSMRFDSSVPSPARVYDYFLGGKDNFAADREAAERSIRVVPETPWFARENRKFLGRAVRFCAAAGITQFLDIGSGLPTMDNVHQVAERVTAAPRVMYVDNDPVVVSHAQALMSGPHAAAARGDLTRPGEILASAPVRDMIDFSQPVAILLVAVLHFIPDDADPAGCVAELMDAAAPGSYLIISHTEISQAHAVGTDYQSEAAGELRDIWKKMPQVPARGRSEIEGFFRGLTLMEPGLVDIWAWRPDSVAAVPATDVMRVLGGVARKGEPGHRLSPRAAAPDARCRAAGCCGSSRRRGRCGRAAMRRGSRRGRR